MIKVKFKILGKPWVLQVLSERTYAKNNGTDSVALTHMSKRKIDLSPHGCDLESIIHELVHAYLHELCTSSADLDNDNLEEIFAELLAKRGKELLQLGEELFKETQKLKESKIIRKGQK